MCGTLQCQLGMQHPVTPNMDQSYSRTIVAMGGQEYECKYVEVLCLFSVFCGILVVCFVCLLLSSMLFFVLVLWGFFCFGIFWLCRLLYL